MDVGPMKRYTFERIFSALVNNQQNKPGVENQLPNSAVLLDNFDIRMK